MDIATYRYLMSALIQVFGALIAVDAIFLLLSYEALKNKFKTAKRQLLLRCVMLREYKRIVPAGNAYDYIHCKQKAENLNLLEIKEINQIIKETKETITDKKKYLEKSLPQSGRHPDIESLQRALEILEIDKTRFRNLNRKVKGFGKFVAKSMVMPAFIAFFLSLELLFADIPLLSSSLLYYGGLSVLLSGVGFILVIYYAIRAIRVSGSDHGEFLIIK